MTLEKELAELKRAMCWYENRRLCFNIEAYHFGMNLIPLLKLSFNDASKRFHPTKKPHQALYSKRELTKVPRARPHHLPQILRGLQKRRGTCHGE
jgi:hypothetical protein